VTVSGTGAAAAVLDLNGNNQTIGALFTGGSGASSSASITLGSGTLTLAGDYTYIAGSSTNGAVISGSGVLSLGNANRTFDVDHVSGATADTIILARVEGTGYTLNKTGSGTLFLNGTSNVNVAVSTGGLGVNSLLNGSATVSSGAILSGSGTVNGNVTVAGGTVNGNGLNLGATTLTGASTLGGITTASSINVASGSTSVTGTTTGSTISVATGATMNNNGTLQGDTSVAGLLNGTGTITGSLGLSGTLAPGNSGAGIATLTGNFTLASTAVLSMEVTGMTGAGVSYDQISVGGNGSLVSLNGTLDLTKLNNMTTLGEQITLILNSSNLAISGTFSTIDVGGIAQTITNSSTSYSDFIYNGTQYQIAYNVDAGDGTANDVILSVVPEPGTWAMMVGGFGLLAFGQRLRRQ
jgi:hypothetical protein